MSAALRPELPPPRLTIAEFMDWADTVEGRWQLRDGVPEAMVPPSLDHGTVQGELAYRLTAHFRATGRPCRVVIGPGVVPRVNAKRTMLVPDLGVTCGPRTKSHALPDPLVLVEILSPSNETATRLDVWAYTTIPSVREVLSLRSVDIGAELLRRQPDGSWPADTDLLGPDATLHLESLDFTLPLRELYVETTLSEAFAEEDARPTNVGKGWTDALDAELREAFAHEPDLEKLASRFRRTRGGIRSRLVRLGVLEP